MLGRRCNVVLGSMSAAMVVENSFWVSAEDTSFFFYPTYLANGSAPNPSDRGQRPSVILRGNTPGRRYGVDTVYLVSFTRIVLSGGQVQYQQVVAGEQWPGFYDLKCARLPTGRRFCAANAASSHLRQVRDLGGVGVAAARRAGRAGRRVGRPRAVCR